MAKRARNQFVSQAALQALVRFGPELSGLRELQRTAEDQATTTVRQAHGTSRAIVHAVDQAAPRVADIYNAAGLDQARTSQTLIGHDLAGLGNVADSIKAGAALESAGMAGRLRESQAGALTELAGRRVQAREGEQFAVQNAQRQLAQDLTKILMRKQDLSREKGAFQAATIGDLTEAAAKRATQVRVASDRNAQSERNSVRSAGIDPDTGKPIPGGKLDKSTHPKSKVDAFKNKYGVKLNTPNEHGAARDRIDARMTDAQAFAKAHIPRSQAASLLVQGVQDQPVLDAQGKQVVEKRPDGSFVKATKKGVKAWGNSLWTTAALDLAYLGRLAPGTAAALHRRGFSVQDLGLPGTTGATPGSAQALADAVNRLSGLPH